MGNKGLKYFLRFRYTIISQLLFLGKLKHSALKTVRYTILLQALGGDSAGKLFLPRSLNVPGHSYCP